MRQCQGWWHIKQQQRQGTARWGKNYQIYTSDQDAPVDRDEDTTEASGIETKERENTSTRQRKENAGKCVEHPGMKFGNNKYGTKFINTE